MPLTRSATPRTALSGMRHAGVHLTGHPVVHT